MSGGEPEPDHAPDWPDDVVVSVAGGVRVFWIAADSMRGLTDRLALILSEHMHDDDELHVTYSSMQSGWQHHPPRKGGLARRSEPGWTELRFEYSAFVILRERAAPPPP